MIAPARVVHMVEDLRTGGLERVVHTIVTTLDRARFSPEVWCLARGGEIAERVAAAGVNVEILGMGLRPSPRFLLALARRLRRTGVRIVHCHGYTASTVGRTAAVLARTPRVFAHVHTLGLWLQPRQRLIERTLALFTERIVCVSESVRHFVVEHEGIPHTKTEVIYNGVPDIRLPDRDCARRAFHIGVGVPVLGCVASLTPQKGHAVLIEAVGIAREQLPDIVLLVVGDGPLRGELERHARRLGVAAVFTGRMERVESALAAMDAVALLSLEREGLSLAVIEALSVSKPVIGSRVGGIPEAVMDGVNGLLCTPADAADAARCITVILGDPVLRDAMGQAGRSTFLKGFTVDTMVSRIECLYGRKH
jgi:glycosyltransferase involved in cell wall biosynthesis